MSCEHWQDEWVARLYDELEPAAARACDAHLAGCAACRATMDRLSSARAALRECESAVPIAPRMTVLAPRRAPHLVWTFAAGAACAMLAFALGLYAGPRIGPFAVPAPQQAAGPGDEAPLTLADVSREVQRQLEQRQQGVDQRLTALENRPDARDEMQRFEARLATERERDLQAVLRSMTASELRTGTWMNETREALQVLAMRQDPRFLER